MKVYISHFIETKELVNLISEFNLGLEIIKFKKPNVLDNCEEYFVEYKREISKINLLSGTSFHGPFSDLIPASRDNEIRRVTRNRFLTAFNIAKKFDSERIIYHTGFIPKTYSSKEWLANSIEFWTDFTKDKLKGMQIHIENVYDHDYFLIKELVNSVNHPSFSVCLDIGHANVYSEQSIDTWIRGMGDMIKHVHLHNNEGSFDNHYGLHRGTVNMLEVLENLKVYCPNASWTLEVVDINDLIESINFLNGYGYIDK